MSGIGTERGGAKPNFFETAKFISRAIDMRDQEPKENCPFWVNGLPTLDREEFPDNLAIFDLLDPEKPVAQSFRKATHDSNTPWIVADLVNAIIAANQLSIRGQIIRHDSYPIIVRVGLLRELDIEHLKKIDGLGGGKAFALKKLFGSNP